MHANSVVFRALMELYDHTWRSGKMLDRFEKIMGTDPFLGSVWSMVLHEDLTTRPLLVGNFYRTRRPAQYRS